MNVIVVYLKLGILKKGDLEFEREKVSAVRKVVVENGNVSL